MPEPARPGAVDIFPLLLQTATDSVDEKGNAPVLNKSISICLLTFAILAPFQVRAQSPDQACEALGAQMLPAGDITAAEYITAGSFSMQTGRGPLSYPDLDAFCRISATLHPVSNSNIRIEVWLPAGNWNNRLVAVGNGGLAGTISYGALAEAVQGGFAAVSTDTGHSGGTPEFLLDDAALTDFAYRAVHEMTLAARQLVGAYYNTGLQFTYFNGCSTGGRQALTAAQRYPLDFDGIVAGAPANSTVRMTMQQLWNSRVVNDTPGLELSAEDFAGLNAAVMAACDSLDGLEDGIIESPASCMADPAEVAGLSAQQVDAIRKIYQGAVNPRTAEVIFPGFAKGSEMNWTAMVNRQPFSYSNNMQSYVVNQDPEWNFMQLDFARDLSVLDARINALGMQAIDPDISEFIAQGGKLLLYHGWNDPLISPFNTVNYYNQVLATVGPAAADSVSLFMMPGVNHCSGGNGFDTWSKLEALDDWRSSGQVPERIEAVRQNAEEQESRPLCAYPEVAVYNGRGDPGDAGSFTCQ